jgi:glutathione S-transferase
MSDEIILYTNPMSRGRIAHWMLEEVGAPYRIELVDFDRGTQKKPELLALNPMGKVPTIVHRGVVVTEAAAVCAYLGDAFPRAGLAPGLDDPRRGTYLRWLFFAAGCGEAALTDKSSPRKDPPPSRALGYGSYDDTLNTLEHAIKPGPYILGETFSAADVYVGSLIGWGLKIGSVEPRPAFLAYAERFAKRPALVRVNAKCEELAQQLKNAS